MLLGQAYHLGEEQVRDGVPQEPFLVLAERRSIEHGLIERQIDEPAEHPIGLQPGAQLPVAPDLEQRLQDLRL